MSGLKRSPSFKLFWQQQRKEKAQVYRTASFSSSTEEGFKLSTPRSVNDDNDCVQQTFGLSRCNGTKDLVLDQGSCIDSNFVCKLKSKRGDDTVPLKGPANLERGAANEMYDVDTALMEIESSICKTEHSTSEESICTCSCYEAMCMEGNSIYSEDCQDSCIEQINIEKEEKTTVKQSEGRGQKFDYWSTVIPWVDHRFNGAYNLVPEDFVNPIDSNSKDSTVTKKSDSQPSCGGNKFENDIFTDDETFFSCTERIFDARESKNSMSALKPDEVHTTDFLENCPSDETVLLEQSLPKQATLGLLVSESSLCCSCENMSPMSFKNNYTMFEVCDSLQLEHNPPSQCILPMMPLVPTPLVAMASFGIQGKPVALQVNTTTPSSACITVTDSIARPLALGPSRTTLNAVSIVSVLSCSSSVIKGIKETSYDDSVSSLHSKNLDNPTTQSLLREIMSSGCNDTVSAFLNGIPLTSSFGFTQPNGNFRNPATAVAVPQHYSHTILQPINQRECPQQIKHNEDSGNEQKALLSNQITTFHSPKVNSMESIPVFHHVQSNGSASTSIFPDFNSTRSSSSTTPMSESTCSGCQPQIHTSCGKIFLPPEFSDIEDNDEYSKQCSYTLVRKTVFNPTRRRVQSNHHFYFSMSSDAPSISERTSRMSDTTPASSFSSMSISALEHSCINTPNSRSVLQVSKKTNMTTSMSCDSVNENGQFHHFSKSGMGNGISSNTNKRSTQVTGTSKGYVKSCRLDYNKQHKITKHENENCALHLDSESLPSKAPLVLQNVHEPVAADPNHLPAERPPLPVPSTCVAHVEKSALRCSSENSTSSSNTLHETSHQLAPHHEVKSGKKLTSKVKKAVLRFFKN